MCGIVGAIAEQNVASILLEGLKRLEYRGYDSAGIAILHPDTGEIQRIRAAGKVKQLQNALELNPLHGSTGIAHTRWATHGVPSEENAHPHMSGNEIALVHNGIIENYEELRHRLERKGYKFTSETDTEVVAHLVHSHLNKKDLLEAVQLTIKELEGAFALAIIHSREPGRIIAVRNGSPLVLGLGEQSNFIASDTFALLKVAERFIFLEDGDIADVRLQELFLYDAKGKPAERKVHTSESSKDRVDRGNYRHYMQKEIFEQPTSVTNTLEGRISKHHLLEASFGTGASQIFDRIQRVQIAACGTSFHAAMVGRYWLEGLANIPCQVEIASEIRYRHVAVQPGTLFVTLSQSGETADTLAALRQAKEMGYESTLSICNVAESSLVRESDFVLLTRAGVEIGVASTKAFTTQLAALLLLTIALGRRHGLHKETEVKLIQQLLSVPKSIEDALRLDDTIKNLAARFVDKEHVLFLGRGPQYPIAMEGALKLKELSYIHAEAYPAGELKHGPLALVDKEMPVVAVAPNDELLEKLKSNLQEVRARGGELIVFADASANLRDTPGITIIKMPKVENSVAPIVYVVPLQLLAYHVAVLKGTDVDQPRNLAKSVTVE